MIRVKAVIPMRHVQQRAASLSVPAQRVAVALLSRQVRDQKIDGVVAQKLFDGVPLKMSTGMSYGKLCSRDYRSLSCSFNLFFSSAPLDRR